MIYFDTDVLVNHCVEQEISKHKQATQIIRQAISDGLLFISTLSINELAFALTKVRAAASRDEIRKHLEDFYLLKPVPVTLEHLERAAQIAYKVGFSHMSDCVHTAIAEQYCNELCTFNRSDFQLIQHHTKLKITIL